MRGDPAVAERNGHDTKRTPKGAATIEPVPHCLDAERALLGSYLLRPELLTDERSAVVDAAFYHERHQIIAKTARTLDAAGVAFDVVTIAERMTADGTLDICGGPAYLLDLIHDTPHAENAPHYATIVRDRARRRQVIAQAQAAAGAARNLTVDVADALAGLDDISAASGASPVRLMGSREFDDADYQTTPLIDGFLMRAKPSIGGGPAKSCKTLIETATIIHGATGTPVFGWPEFTVPTPFRSAFFSMESGGATVRANARSICHSLGFRLSDLDGMVFWQMESLKLSDAGTLTALRREIERKEIDYLVVDPLYLSLNLDADDAKSVYAMGARLGEVAKVVDDTGCSIKLLHHGIKRPQEPLRPMKLVDLSGAGVQEWPGQWGLLARRADYDEERRGYHELWFRVGGRDFGGSLLALDINEFSDFGERREWSITARPASEAAAEIIETSETRKRAGREAQQEAAVKAALDRMTPKALRYLRKAKNRRGVSEAALRNGVGGSGRIWSAVFSQWLEAETVVECSYLGKNKRAYDGYQLPEYRKEDKQDDAGLKTDSPADPAAPQGGGKKKDCSPLEGNNPDPSSASASDDDLVPF